jgi:endonuclease/exonuclease/phosphatase family metal-dependent hydrolase
MNADTAPVRIRAISWNVFHGRDAPPDRALRTWRSRLLRITERNRTHVQVNRDLYREFAALIRAAEWDVLLLQEFPPRWAGRLGAECAAECHLALTSRNSFGRLRALLARLNPDLIGSAEGGSNLTLVRGSSIVERRELVIRAGAPERRVMAFTRLDGGLSVGNLHATNDNPPLATQEVRLAAETADGWAEDGPLILGGDFNLRPERNPEVFAELDERFGLGGATAPDAIDHLLSRGLEVIEPPRRWPHEAREVRSDGLALRLSDHAPVEALFEAVGEPQPARRSIETE